MSTEAEKVEIMDIEEPGVKEASLHRVANPVGAKNYVHLLDQAIKKHGGKN